MPSARALLLLPVPAPQLQLWRSATTATTATSATLPFHPTSCASASGSCCGQRRRPCAGSRRPVAAGQQCRYASTTGRRAAAPMSSQHWLLPPVRSVGPKGDTARRPRPFGTATNSRQTQFPRHGKAVEPLVGDVAETPAAEKTEPTITNPSTQAEAAAPELEQAPLGEPVLANCIELGPPSTPAGPIDTILSSSAQDAAAATKEPAESPPTTNPSTSSASSSPLHQPHMTPPLYVHHFDSYSLVRQLEDSGYQRAQAITAMKAVRTLLAYNMAVAQRNLVSKSDVENEAYLFKAACAELGIEVRNRRRRADEQTRQQRALLQHEVDIAAQSVNQELLTLNDTVRGLFNDRKMAVREEQKAAESAIQKLNYKITIMLNSETRSEIERLRWVLIRRSVLGIIFMAVVTLGSLRYASYRSHEKQREAERAAREAEALAEALRKMDIRTDLSSPPDAAEILTAN